MINKKEIKICLVSLLALMLLPAVLAETRFFHPTYGEDATKRNETIIFSSQNLSLVSLSDDKRWVSAGAWNIPVYDDNEYILWGFTPNISKNARITDASLKFEWQRGPWVRPFSRLLIWDESESEWKTHELTNPHHRNDEVVIVTLPYISTTEDVNNFKIKFQTTDDPIPRRRTAHDLVELKISFEIDDDAPTCSVEYLKDKKTNNKFNLDGKMTYLKNSGNFYVFGSATDSKNKIINVQHNRTSPSISFAFTDADPVDGAFNELKEDWKSKPNNPDSFSEGISTLCCRAVDEENNVGEGSCKTVCIDKKSPPLIENLTPLNQSSCNPNYTSVPIVFSWDKISDLGCSGLDYYEVNVFEDSKLISTLTSKNPIVLIPNPKNGKAYSVRVRAVDKAGNKGLWSKESQKIIYDDTPPGVKITYPKQGSWFKMDFNLSEEDSDNVGLFSCEYKITNNGLTTLNWTKTECNEGILIDISKYCPKDSTCRVYKRVKDNACNEDTATKYFKLDRTPPKTTKKLNGPSYPKGSWLGKIIDFFIKPETKIVFSCSDNGTGCNSTFYRINKGNWTLYSGPFTLGEKDESYLVEYYSVDNIGNKEDVKNETDKIDTIPPKTNLSYVGPFVFGKRNLFGFNLNIRFINSKTNITLKASDSQSGINQTYFGILVPCKDKNCSHKEWYGNLTSKWYESRESCESDNQSCILTYWKSQDGNSSFMENLCGNKTFFDSENNLFVCPYKSSIKLDEYSEHKICYYSKDNLLNKENLSCDAFSVDNRAPGMIIHNPSKGEEFKRCYESIVVEAFDDKSGVDKSSVVARLYDSNNTMVAGPLNLEWRNKGLLGGDIFMGVLNTEIPAGNYTLKVSVKDRLGNENVKEFKQTFNKGVYVEYLAPSSCSISVENGGTCELGFNLCLRGANSISMWMDKLGKDPKLIAPEMLNARIKKGNMTAKVGLLGVGESGKLMLGENEINGKTSLRLIMDFSSNLTKIIGGDHKVVYKFEAFNLS